MTTTLKTAPKLKGGNTINQAAKPRKIPVTLPLAAGILPDQNAYLKLQDELSQSRQSLFVAEKEKMALAGKVQDLTEKLTATQRILNRYGVGVTPK